MIERTNERQPFPLIQVRAMYTLLQILLGWFVLSVVVVLGGAFVLATYRLSVERYHERQMARRHGRTHIQITRLRALRVQTRPDAIRKVGGF